MMQINNFKHKTIINTIYGQNTDKIECSKGYTNITRILKNIERANCQQILIKPSELGGRLKQYTTNKLHFPIIHNNKSITKMIIYYTI